MLLEKQVETEAGPRPDADTPEDVSNLWDRLRGVANERRIALKRAGTLLDYSAEMGKWADYFTARLRAAGENVDSADRGIGPDEIERAGLEHIEREDPETSGQFWKSHFKHSLFAHITRIYWAWVLTVLWQWFILSHFPGAPALNLWAAWSIGQVLTLFYKGVPNYDREEFCVHGQVANVRLTRMIFLNNIVMPSTSLLGGFIAHFIFGIGR